MSNFLHRLGLAQKFVILGLLALCMVVPPTTLYLQRAFGDVASAQRQVHGGEALAALNRVIQFTQVHRGLSAAMLSGNDALAQRRPGVSASLGQTMERVDEALKNIEALPRTQAQWVQRRQAWAAIEPGVAARQLSAEESTRLHTELIAGEFLIGEALMDEYGLSLDRQLSTHMLARASLQDAMVLTEFMGLMRARGTALLSQGEMTPQGRATLQALLRQAQKAHEDWFRNLGKAFGADAAIQTRLEAAARQQREAIGATLLMANQDLIEAEQPTLKPDVYFDTFTRTIDGVYTWRIQK